VVAVTVLRPESAPAEEDTAETERRQPEPAYSEAG
jgi:hypothetical protein